MSLYVASIVCLILLYVIRYRISKKLEKDLESSRNALRINEDYYRIRKDVYDRMITNNINNTIRRQNTVYYVPRLNEIVEYKELEELGEL